MTGLTSKPNGHISSNGLITLAPDNTLNTSWERISTFLTLEERERVLSNQTRARVIK
jgi:hypothetical protein